MIDHVFWWTGMIAWLVAGGCGLLWTLDHGVTYVVRTTGVYKDLIHAYGRLLRERSKEPNIPG